MKKFMSVCAALFMLLAAIPALADNDRAIRIDQLPQAAQNFLKQHFAETPVAFAAVEREMLGHEYRVILVPGWKIEFDGKGEWKEVDCRHDAVPAAIIPQAIREYVERSYPGTFVIGIDRNRHGYEVKISHGLELEFDTAMRLVDIDD